jgi:hypothetical protein
MYEVQGTKYKEHSGNTVEINRTLRGLPTVGRRAGTLGEIVNPAVISTYFTEPVTTGISLYYFTKRSGVYFNYISIAFPFNYFTERSAVYFYPISIVFRLPAAAGISYLVLRTLYLVHFTKSQHSPQTISCSP